MAAELNFNLLGSSPHANTQTAVSTRRFAPAGIALAATLIACSFLALTVPRIDFHADEAIYLQGIPISTSNDSGLLYHFAYSFGTFETPTPMAARFASLVFGAILIFATTRAVQGVVPKHAAIVGILNPMLITLSYQGVFTIVRVRPEISWCAITSIAIWSLVELRQRNTVTFRIVLWAALLLLPMNHMLSFFPCFLLAAYIVLFMRTKIGWAGVVVSIACMGVGVLLNSAIRSFLAHGHVQLIPQLFGGAPGQSVTLLDFLKNVFWASPSFLKDSAATSSLWNALLWTDNAAWLSHCFVATALWATALALPLFARSLEQLFVVSVPLFVLALFFLSGYFNPTYAPILSIYVVAIWLYQFKNQRSLNFRKFATGALLGLSLLNGLSFLSTRILNHGPASFFAVEAELRKQVASLPPGSVVAIAERFRSVVQDFEGQVQVLFKDPLSPETDYVALDSYDFEMYRFVPDYEQREREIQAFLAQSSALSEHLVTVYENESLHAEAVEQAKVKALQSSWFFRNSTAYKVSLLEHDASYLRTARPPSNLQRRSER